MRLAERKTSYPKCDKQGNLTKVDYIEIKNKGLAEEKLLQLEDILEGHNIETLEELDGVLWYVKEIKKLEQELGIDLITLFKALKQETLFIKTDFDIRETIKNGEGWGMKHLSFEVEELVIFAQILYPNDITHKEWLTPLRLKLNDYGKTWALTKEELL